MCKTPVVSCCEEQSIALSLLYLLSLPQINQSQDWSVPDWDTLKWGNWVADWSTKAQNLSAQKGSASVGDNLQLERKQLLLTEGWVKMRLSNYDKENCWQFLASSAYPCKECTSREAGPARSLAQGGRVGQSLGVPQVGWSCCGHCWTLPCRPIPGWPWSFVTTCAPRQPCVPPVLSRAVQSIAELQVQLFQQQECVYYLCTCLQAPTLVFTFYLLKFYWCFQLRNWFSFPLLKQPQNWVCSVSDCKQLSWSTLKAAPLW